MNHRLTVALLALCGMLATSAQAQAPAEAAVRAVIDQLFDGMRAGDSTAVRAAFHPEARLMSVGMRDGRAVLRADAVDAFVKAVGTPHDAVWDERLGRVEIRVDGALATAWTAYRFYAGEQFSHCGVNAFQLFEGERGWQIIQITDTRRREPCPEG